MAVCPEINGDFCPQPKKGKDGTPQPVYQVAVVNERVLEYYRVRGNKVHFQRAVEGKPKGPKGLIMYAGTPPPKD